LSFTNTSIDPTGKVDVSGLINPFLIRLEVRRGNTNDFLPTVDLLSDIKYPKIGDEVTIQGNDPADLL
jgi:hypothetical protein